MGEGKDAKRAAGEPYHVGAPASAARDASAAKAPGLLPSITVPKGGGAIRGIGETFSTNAATGTNALSVPVATSPGRGGFELGLTLSYDSGSGNGPFGLGWTLSTPSITRKTDKGLPRYQDGDDSDTFVMSGAEDLVPILVPEGNGTRVDAFDRGEHRIQRYRPRTEGLFARIERWTNRATSDVHWRAITRDNVLSVYGRRGSARVADPERPAHVFSWLLEETHDDRGNVARYTYKAEDLVGIDIARSSESSRVVTNQDGSPLFLGGAQRYLKRIQYGNRVPVVDRNDPAPADDDNYLFEVVFDYGDHAGPAPTPIESALWSLRDDAFSSYRSTFEVRTYRLCQRILMFHRFAELGPTPCLVRSTDLGYRASRIRSADGSYDEGPVSTYLASVIQAGYLRPDPAGPYERATMPPLDLGYVEPILHDELRVLAPGSQEGIEGTDAQWVDLDGEGIPGLLIPGDRAWYFKANLGEGRLALPVLERNLPAPAELRRGAQQLTDLGGDGNLDLVSYEPALAGYFERTPDRDWAPFVAFPDIPNIDWNDANLRFVDLDGDGFPDVLVTEQEAIVWYRSRTTRGFEPAALAPKSKDEVKGPAVVFASSSESISLADMSGDGLVDLVRVRANEVCYWPNLGYGRFGRKVTLDDSPRLDAPDQFDPARVRFADIDGSGTSDVVYLGRDGVRIYFNRSGNGLSKAKLLQSLPPIDSSSTLSVVDLLGQGTSCLVWSSSLPERCGRPVAYVDLLRGRKPHLLDRVVNNLGAETRIAYASSTRFYLQDKAAGRPWLTRLAFPVQVVERVEHHDHVAKSKLITTYAYHHGYFDGYERELRGFARVEQWDAESFSDAADPLLNLPPVRTVTWFHTGAYLERERLERSLAREYYGDLVLPDTVLEPGVDANGHRDRLSVREEREATRVLRGQILRQEVYAEDGTDAAGHPYSVSERNYAVRRLQRVAGERHGVFFAHPLHTVNVHYERGRRDPATGAWTNDDPRVQHEVVLAVDDLGNVTQSAALGYPRRAARLEAEALAAETSLEEQRRLWATVTCATFAHRDDAGSRRIGVPVETITSELVGLPGPDAGVYTVEQLAPLAGAIAIACDRDRRPGEPSTPKEQAALDAAEACALALLSRPASGLAAFARIPFEEAGSEPAQLRWRVVERQRQVYYRDYPTVADYWADALGPLPLGETTALALLQQTYRQAATPGLITQIHGASVSEELLKEQGRYVLHDGAWWCPSGRVVPDPARFMMSAGVLDTFGERYRVRQDDHELLMLDVEDPLGNRVTAGRRDASGAVIANGNDYRVLASATLCDPNGSRTRVVFDALGMVAKLWALGRDGLDEGDDEPRPGIVFEYDLHAFREGRGPAFAHVATREIHRAGGDPLAADGRPRRDGFQHVRSYSDGSGREVMKKVQAEPGPVPIVGPDGHLQRSPDGAPLMRDETARWVGTGRTVLDNKGNPVKTYEPFFSGTIDHEDEVTIVEWGVTPILQYDPLGRLIRTDRPNGTHALVTFDAWKRETWDENDTVLDSRWYPRWRASPGNAAQLLAFVRGFAPSWSSAPTDLQCAGELCRLLGIHAPTALDVTWLLAPTVDVPVIWKAAVARGGDLRRAAELAARHALTPTVSHLDALDRSFVTVADRGGDAATRKHRTRVELDVRGNELAITDPRGIRTFERAFDQLGRAMRVVSRDAGESRTLVDAADKPVCAWDPRGYSVRRRYDALQRPTHLFAQKDVLAERLVEHVIYGESSPDAAMHNLRTRVRHSYDAAGVVTNVRFDFKGNLAESKRRLARELHEVADWSALEAGASNVGDLVEPEAFATVSRFDAMNRLVSATTPDASETRPSYDEAGLLTAIDVRLRAAPDLTPFVTNIAHDARGLREAIAYANGTTTRYTYDPESLRLVRQVTARDGGDVLQDLTYTHDPVGNIVATTDAAPHGNPDVSADGAYEYDALYRLIEAKGRENPGQQPTDADAEQLGLPSGDHPNDWAKLRRYQESYAHDAAGNLVVVAHASLGMTTASWTRRYRYAEDSNRLLGASAPGDAADVFSATYEHDAAGNMTRMPHLPAMEWDHADRLQHVGRQVQGGAGPANGVHFTYDSAGQRVRKVYEHSGIIEERVYVGSYELYRRRAVGADRPDMERQTLHVMDDQTRVALVETKTIDAAMADFTPSTRQRFQLASPLGSTAMELDAGAAVISYEEYGPLGTTAFRAADGTADVSARRYRYTGKERDEETALYYHGARYYAPWLGRWTSCDPSGPAGGVNLYAYAAGNPIRYADETGLAPSSSPVEASSKPAEAVKELLKLPPSPAGSRVDVKETKDADGNVVKRTVKLHEFDKKNADGTGKYYEPYLLATGCFVAGRGAIVKWAPNAVLVEGGYLSDPDKQSAHLQWARMSAFDPALDNADHLVDGHQNDIVVDPERAREMVDYFTKTIDRALPVLVGVNESGSDAGLSKLDGDRITDHHLDLYGYDLEVVDGEWRPTKLYGLDNATGPFTSKTRIELDVGPDFKATKPGADNASTTNGRVYQITSARFYKKDFADVKQMKAYWGPDRLVRRKSN